MVGTDIKFLLIYPVPFLVTPLPLMAFATEEITGCTNKAAKVAHRELRNLLSCFFIQCFTV